MPRRDTSWHLEFLNLVAGGESFDQAAKLVGSNGRTLYNHFEAFPDFRAEAWRLRQTSGRAMTGVLPDHSHVPRLVALICSGLTIPQTAHVLGVAPRTVQNWVTRPPARELIEAQRTGRKFGARRWPVNIDDLLPVLRGLASGLTLADACAAAKVPAPTMKRWRRCYSEVDAAVVAAAMDGRWRKIRPMPVLECPGVRCGTKTGYDYGCDREPCRTAVAEREAQRRSTTKEKP